MPNWNKSSWNVTTEFFKLSGTHPLFLHDTSDKNRSLNQMCMVEPYIYLLPLAEFSNFSLQPMPSDSHCNQQSAILLSNFLCSHLGSYLAIPVALAIQVALSTQAVLEDPGDQGHLWQQCFVQWCLVNLADLRESSLVLDKPRWKRALGTVSVIYYKIRSQELYQCKE